MPLRLIELILLALLLIGLGFVHFSRLTPQERDLIQLEARLEQLYLLEKEYFAKHGRYFDPNDKKSAARLVAGRGLYVGVLAYQRGILVGGTGRLGRGWTDWGLDHR